MEPGAPVDCEDRLGAAVGRSVGCCMSGWVGEWRRAVVRVGRERYDRCWCDGWKGGRLECAPNHPTLRPRHTPHKHTRVVLDTLRNQHAGLRSAGRVRAGHRVREARGPRVTELLDRAPSAEAGVARFALGAVGVVAGVLVEGDGVGEVRGADDVAAASAVVFAEVPGEVCLAEGAAVGGFVGLEGGVSGWFIEVR
jgi:hypothetical protein